MGRNYLVARDWSLEVVETLYLVSTSAEGLCLLKVMDLDFDKKGHCSKLEIEKNYSCSLFEPFLWRDL